jgi:putative Mn2+ efflux pump MntP
MFALAVVDSFDVLAVSITFPELHINLPLAMVIIGVTTFIIAALGVKVGSLFGGKFRTRATVFGGMILIIIGTHLLLKGLGILSILPFL